ncbi:MAG: hypothetical protein ACRC8B_13515 [Aeromonas sobria]|uniref:hypothetical protein n=1 Tax=Aeromonas sobria TaxID=646 RepID=UPI003F30ABD2
MWQGVNGEGTTHLFAPSQEKGDIDRLQEIMNEVKKRESKNLVTLSSDECAVYASTGVKKYNQIINN